QVAQLQAHTAPPPWRKCPVAMPDKFDGNQAMFPAFVGQCQLFISLRAEYFPTDQDKVGFMISLLSGAAACWATPLPWPPQLHEGNNVAIHHMMATLHHMFDTHALDQ
uniref:DUF4939 domain-containing protein n=1 Tax=Naja naja TaxID=35670 RepID=A0A8C7DZU3_NAJNA